MFTHNLRIAWRQWRAGIFYSLNGHYRSASISAIARKALVILQFTVSVILIIATAALNEVAKVFRHYDPQSPFEPRFLADDYALKFAAEQQVAHVASVFAILAVFISCLGLFGLASFMAEQRTKEIGIRKVLGATVTQLITLLSLDFLKLILLSLCLAIPLSAWAMHRWLENYPYHTALQPWIFAAAGTTAIVIAMITTSFHALKAALANPVASLRTE